jgi:hypothetical protein
VEACIAGSITAHLLQAAASQASKVKLSNRERTGDPMLIRMRLDVPSAHALFIPRANQFPVLTVLLYFFTLPNLCITLFFHFQCLHVLVISISPRIFYIAFSLFVSVFLFFSPLLSLSLSLSALDGSMQDWL